MKSYFGNILFQRHVRVAKTVLQILDQMTASFNFDSFCLSYDWTSRWQGFMMVPQFANAFFWFSTYFVGSESPVDPVATPNTSTKSQESPKEIGPQSCDPGAKTTRAIQQMSRVADESESASTRDYNWDPPDWSGRNTLVWCPKCYWYPSSWS